jgi:hypothetical protein
VLGPDDNWAYIETNFIYLTYYTITTKAEDWPAKNYNNNAVPIKNFSVIIKTGIAAII